MRILSVTTVLPSEDAEWWRIYNIANQLKSFGAEIDFVHYIIKGFESYKKLNSKNYSCDENSIIISSPISVHFKHLKTICAKKYDLVYGNTYTGAFVSTFGKLLGVPLILDMHGVSEEFLMMEKKPGICKISLLKFMEFISLHSADKIICVSKKMIDYLHEKKGIPFEKMIYETNGVDLDFFNSSDLENVRQLKKSLGIENEFVFGYIGGFQNYQGVDNFIEAAKKIDNKETQFLIIGGSKNSRENNITFVSKVPRSQIPDYYSLCDVLVLPRPTHLGTEVAAPTKFAEYCAIGKPILTTDVGDAAELVKKYRNGIIVENNSPDNLKKGIIKFLTLKKDTIFNMGKNSRKVAECEFNWEIICSNLIKELNLVNR